MKFNKEAKKSLRKGVNRVVNAVKVTAGAEGKLVFIENKMGFPPQPTKDGVTVVNAVIDEDRYEAFGANAIKQAANLTVDKEGDGTTATSVIAGALINSGLDVLENTNISHVELKEGMQMALEDVKSSLNFLKTNIKTDDRMIQIASISANNDAELGELIASVYKKVGVDSTIEVREGMTSETTTNYVEGICLERGYAVPHFCNDFNKGTCELENAYVLIYNGEIKTTNEVQEYVVEALTKGKPLLIIADDVQEAVMASFVKLKMGGNLQVCISISPDFGVNRENILKDLAIATGASVFNPKFPEPVQLGFAKKVIAFSNKTVVLSEGNEEAIDARIEEIKEKIKTADKFEIDKYKKRVSNLKSALAEIIVGGTSDMDIKEKKDRVDDAVASLRSALIGGYVAGGGSTLFYIANNDMKRNLKGGQYYGYKIVKEAIQKPFYQILENAGIEVKTAMIDSILAPSRVNISKVYKDYGVGVNVKTRKVENMFSSGIIDSARVIETAVENAVNVSYTIFSTDVLILSESL